MSRWSGELFHQSSDRVLWLKSNNDPTILTNWTAAYRYDGDELDTSSWGENERGYHRIDRHDGRVYTWNGSIWERSLEPEIRETRAKIRTKPFRLFDTTPYTNKPNLLELYGIQRGRIYFENTFFNGQPDHTALPFENTVKNIARNALQYDDDVLIITDIESYHFYTDDEYGAQQRANHIQVFDWMYEIKQDMNLGMYGFLPRRDYPRAIRRIPGYENWQFENELVRPIVDKVKYLAPSLYVLNGDPWENWVRYAVENIKEARRYAGDKPVYPFIWPRYHNTLPPGLALKLVEPEFWALQLRVLYEIADGAIIWTGSWDLTDWDENMPWWVETKKFLRHIGQI